MSSITRDEFFKLYRIHHKVGEGGYGSVYRITENETLMNFALKTIVCQNLDHLSASMQEITLIIAIKNPNLIKVHRFMMDSKQLQHSNGQFYQIFILGIIMDYADFSLFDDITHRRPLKRFYNKEIIKSLLISFVQLLKDLQEKNIAHRDLKPENILITKTGFKLTDFGLAKQSENGPLSHIYAGSPYYVSPKLRSALEKDNFNSLVHNIYKSDVFSLGLNILEAASLCDIRLCNANSNSYTIEEILKKVDDLGYDKWFIEVLRLMLDFDESKRPDFIELNEIIKKKMILHENSNPFKHWLNTSQNIIKEIGVFLKETEEISMVKNSFSTKTPEFEYENFLVKGRNYMENAGLPTILSNEKIIKVLDEKVLKTEIKEKKPAFDFLNKTYKEEDFFNELINRNERKSMDSLSKTKEMHKKKIIHQTFLLLEHIVPNSTSQKDQMDFSPLSQILTSCILSGQYLITAGEECIDVFKIKEPNNKPIQNIQRLRYQNLRFNAITPCNLLLKNERKQSIEKIPQNKENLSLYKQFLISGTNCGKLILYSIEPQSESPLDILYKLIAHHPKGIISLFFNEKDQLLITGSIDFSVRFIQLTLNTKNQVSGVMIRVLTGHSGGISTVQWSDFNDLAVSSGGVDKLIIVWDKERKKKRNTIKWDCDWVTTMKVVGEKAFCGSGNKGLAVFNLETGDLESKYEDLNQFFNGWISFIDYYKEWKILLICEGKGRVLIYDDLNNRRKILNFEEDSDICSCFLVKKEKCNEFMVIVTHFDGKIRYLEIDQFDIE